MGLAPPIRIAAIGVGHWHSLFDAAYLKTLARMPEVQLVGVQDSDPALAEQRAEQIGAPPVFTDYRDMLDQTKPDFVLALGRHDAMAATAHYLLDQGYPFLIEKPVGLNAQQVRGVADKAATQSTFAGVPLFHRLQPFVTHARRMLAESVFGPVSHFYFRSNRPTSARYLAWGVPWMLDPAIAGGGCLRNVGIHGIDAFLYITGEDAEVTGAQISSRTHGHQVEDYATVLLRTPSGILGTIEVGNTFPGKGGDAGWKLAGRDALLSQQDGALRITTAAGTQAIDDQPAAPMPELGVRDALARWQRGEPPAVTIGDCYRAVRLVDAAYAIARQ